MVVDVLIRDARVRAGLTQAELARRAGTSQAAVARYEGGAASPAVSTLERLLRAAGAELRLEAVASPAADLSSPRAAKLRRHRHQILRLCRSAGASHVRVFGSVARGDDDPDSDVDLLVDYDLSRGLLPIVDLVASLTALLDERVDVAPVALLKPAIASRALAEAVPL